MKMFVPSVTFLFNFELYTVLHVWNCRICSSGVAKVTWYECHNYLDESCWYKFYVLGNAPTSAIDVERQVAASWRNKYSYKVKLQNIANHGQKHSQILMWFSWRSIINLVTFRMWYVIICISLKIEERRKRTTIWSRKS